MVTDIPYDTKVLIKPKTSASEYIEDVQKHLPWIKADIRKSKDGYIKIHAVYFRWVLGEKYMKKHITSLYNHLKPIFFVEGLKLSLLNHRVRKNCVFKLRFCDENDKLPESSITRMNHIYSSHEKHIKREQRKNELKRRKSDTDKNVDKIDMEYINAIKEVYRTISPKVTFEDYIKDTREYIPWIKEQIRNSNTGYINIKVTDLAKTLGEKYMSKNVTTLYNHLKPIFFVEGLKLSIINNKDPEKSKFDIRLCDEQDMLPDSSLIRMKHIYNSYDKSQSKNEVLLKENE